MAVSTAPTTSSLPDAVSAETVAFLAELARLPAIQNGDVEAVASLICERCLGLTDVRYISVWMLDPDQAMLRSIARYDRTTRSFCAEIAISGSDVTEELAILRNATQIASDDALTDQRLEGVRESYLRPQGITAVLEHVIRVSGKDVGLLSLEQTGKPRPWKPSDSALTRGLCSYLALTSVNRQKIALEQQAAETSALQAAILENAAYAVIATDVDGQITFFNRAAEKMLGYQAAELVNKTGPILFHDPEEVIARAKILSDHMQRSIAPGFEVFIAKTLAGEANEDEWTYIRKDGSRLTALLSVTAIRDARGQVTGFLGMASDVTERNRVASRLRQSEDILSRVLLQSPDAILVTALDSGRILDVNPGFEQITGYRRTDVIGKTTVDLSIWVDLAERNEMLRQVRAHGEVRSMPVQISRHGGDRRQCILWGRIFEYAGEQALLTSVHDVTDLREAEQAASESRRMLQAVLDAVPSHVFWKDRNSVYLGCNRQFALDNGFTDPAEVVGKTDYDQLSGHSPEQLAENETILATDRQLVASKQPAAPRTALFVKPDGSVRWVNVAKTPLLDQDGDVIGILGVQHDVTEFLESEKSARDSQQMLRSVLDTIPSGVFWKDRNSVYIGSNRQFAKDAEQGDPGNIVGKTDADMIWRDNAKTLVEDDRQVIATAQPILDQISSYAAVDGKIRWFETDKVPLITEAGEVKGVLGVQHDITEQLRRQEIVRAGEEKLRALFTLSPFGINLQNMDGRYLEVNAAFLDIVGYDLEEIKKLTCYDLIPDEYLDIEPDRLRALRETGLIPAYEKEYRCKDGSRVPVSTTTVLVPGLDGEHYKWTIVENITERRKTEEAQRRLNDDLERLVTERTFELKSAMEGLMRAEKLASLGSLVAGVAHEISTPVGNASLASSTLVGAIGEFEQQMAGKLSRSMLESFVKQIKLGVDIANRNIERVAGLIQSFKQVAVDQTSSQRRQFQLTEVVDEILTTMHPSLKRRAVTTTVSVPPDIVLDSYPGPLGQVLTNLINNSLLHAFPSDASAKDKVSVKDRPRTIRIKAALVDHTHLRLEVSDDGSGMAASVLGRIFDPFFTSKLGHGGSGLGLHIVHSIVADMLAGTIAVASEVGVGTTFTIIMPCKTPVSAMAEAQGMLA